VNGYLLDTNVCIEFFKKNPRVGNRLEQLESGQLFNSAITLAELKYGAHKSQRLEYHLTLIAAFLDEVEVLSIDGSIDQFAMEKARLSKAGSLVDNFDLLIGSTAVHHGLTLVTNNTKHFQRIQGIQLEDWTQ
jgi:tRNA(fMet)-specific endonuclease VapC